MYEAASGEVSLVADINPSGGSSPGALVPVSGVIYFSAYEPASGRELFRLDGDIVTRVLDLNPGAASSSPYLVGAITTDAGERLLFSGRSADQVTGLYTTNGTGPGTVRIFTFEQENVDLYKAHALYQGRVYFRNYSPENGLELWQTDGTASSPAGFAYRGGRLYFTADDGLHGREPWAYYLPAERYFLPAVSR